MKSEKRTAIEKFEGEPNCYVQRGSREVRASATVKRDPINDTQKKCTKTLGNEMDRCTEPVPVCQSEFWCLANLKIIIII